MEFWGCFHGRASAGTGTVIEPIQERDHLLAIQCSKIGHHLGGELVLVECRDVMFNFIRTSPLELAERALAPRLVFFLQVSLQLLDPLKLPIAFPTLEILHTAEHVTARSNRISWVSSSSFSGTMMDSETRGERNEVRTMEGRRGGTKEWSKVPDKKLRMRSRAP